MEDHLFIDEQKLSRVLDLAEKLSQVGYQNLTEEEKDDDAIVIALLWSAVACGLHQGMPPRMLRLVLHFGVEAVLEELTYPHTIH